MSIEIVAYGCSSAAGDSVPAFWSSLKEGRDRARAGALAGWGGGRPEPAPELKTFSWDEPPSRSALDVLVGRLGSAWDEAVSAGVETGALGRVGVILASTKGCIEDLVWDMASDEPTRDPCTPVLEAFIQASGLKPHRALCVSNACASSLAALALARQWLAQDEVDHVVVAAADRVGPFVAQGFQSLRALSADRVRPFAHDRSGLQLGEAAAVLVLKRAESHSGLRLLGVGLDTEGFAVTRPSDGGESLSRACGRALSESRAQPDLIVAHGTATPLNDAAEDRVFASICKAQGRAIPVTATKWCIGHTLGTSGAMDVIAACEALKRQEVFRIASTSHLDPLLVSDAPHATYLHDKASAPECLETVLITSLGFGGTHAAVVVGRVESEPERVKARGSLRATADVKSFTHRFAFPAREEPGWKHLVDRWYQLDAPAYGLAQAYWQWKPDMGELPSLLILASPGASNETDRAFTRTGATSPAKFVHTLANVRSSPLCQVMGWAGPMLCLQADPRTQEAALEIAAEWVGPEYPCVWVVGCEREAGGYVARAWVLSDPTGA